MTLPEREDDLPYFCICDEEMCWCANRVVSLDMACRDCKNGDHVMTAPTPSNIGNWEAEHRDRGTKG